MVAAIFKIRIINENPWFSFHIPIEERVAVNFLNLLNSQNQTMGPGWYFSQKKMVLIDEEIKKILIY